VRIRLHVIGAGMGFLAHDQNQPFVLRIAGNGVYAGLKVKF
jgi:hypothetical protein